MKASGAQVTPNSRSRIHPPAPRGGRSFPVGAEPTPLAHRGGTSPTLSVPAAPRAFSPSFKGPLPASRAARFCPQPEQLACARGPLLLLGLASSGTSYYPLHEARYCPHVTEPLHFHVCSGPWLVPTCVFPPHASAQPGFRGGGSCGDPGTEALSEVWGPLLLPQAGRSWLSGTLGRPFTVMSGLGVDARGQQRPSLGALGSQVGHWARPDGAGIRLT